MRRLGVSLENAPNKIGILRRDRLLFDGLIRALARTADRFLRDGAGGRCAAGLGFAQPFGDGAFGGAAIVERG